MFESILFIVTTLILCVGLILFPKNKAKLNLVTWIIATITSVIALLCLMAGIINLFGVPVNLVSLSVINIVVSLVAIIYMIIKKKCQKYFVAWQDVLVVLLMAVVTIVVGYIRFGARMDVFAYESDDSVRHFSYAMELVNTQKITSQRYVLYLLNMIFIKCFEPLTGEFYNYTAFMKTDLFLLFLMGSMFWVLIRRFITSKFAMVTGIVMALMYWLGYPFNSFLHGFEYLGAGILMITYLLWVLQKMEFDELPAWINTVLLMFANLGVCVSYTQFAPAVLIGEIIYLLIFYKKRKQIFSWNTLGIVLLGLGIPGILCVCYVAPNYLAELLPVIGLVVAAFALLVFIIWLGLFIQSKIIKKTVRETLLIDKKFLMDKKAVCIILLLIGVVILLFLAYKYVYLGMIVRFAAEQGMVADGHIYREPYANFIALMFPLFGYIADCVKNRKNDASLWMLIGTIAFSIWLIRCILLGSVGSYYFYKMHYIMWLFLYLCAFRYISGLTGEAQKQMRIYLISVLALFMVFVSGVEKKLVEIHDWLWTDNVGTTMFGIYDYNLYLIQKGGNVSEDMQVIYNVVHSLKMENENIMVPYFGIDYRYIKDYYYYLSGQNPYMVPQYLNDYQNPVDDIIWHLKFWGIIHIFVENDYEGPYAEIFANLHTEFETEYGSIKIIE